jgi:hypothetical protein
MYEFPEGITIQMQQTLRSARRLLNPRAIALRLIAVVITRPKLRQQVKALAARFPTLERRLKARIFSLPAASEMIGAAQGVPAEPVCGQAQWLHAYLEAQQVARP